MGGGKCVSFVKLSMYDDRMWSPIGWVEQTGGRVRKGDWRQYEVQICNVGVWRGWCEGEKFWVV